MMTKKILQYISMIIGLYVFFVIHIGTAYGANQCGSAANTGQSTMPNSNLCMIASTTSSVWFDNERNIRSRSCTLSNTTDVCTAWLNTSNTFAPTCNTSMVNNNTISAFPGHNGCSYGSITNRQLSLNGNASRQCFNNLSNGQTSISNSCGTFNVTNYNTVVGTTCNSSITNKSFDNTYQLLQYSLCENGGMAGSFNLINDRRKRTCGLQSCEATKSSKSMCGRATNQSRRTYPNNGICTEGIASTIRQSNGEWGWICTTNLLNIQQFNNSSCTTNGCLLQVLDFYNGKTAVCTAPRITDGECKGTTQMNINGFSDPDQVLQSGLCESGTPDPLLPNQDLITKKWSRRCKSTIAGGIDSPQCFAKVKIPNLSIIYQPQTTNGAITAVSSIVTGFNTTYITFDTPINQYYKLFTQNGYFFFTYHDRAGNTGSVLAVVDTIQNNLPSATVVMNPIINTTGNVIVSLSNFNRPQTPTVTFTGACLTLGTCTKNSSINPYLFTVTFNNNGTGQFDLVDANGLTNTIPVSVSTIDRNLPSASLLYDNTNPTNTGVRVSLINPNKPIKVLNNNGLTGYLFTGNGSFVFQISDMAGNTNNITAYVNWINKSAPGANIVYSTTSTTTDNVIATLTNFSTPGTIIVNNSGSSSYTFTYNKEFIFVLKDLAGNLGSVKASVNWINKPIAMNLTSIYKNKICNKRTASPDDTDSQLYNYYIQTVINNCIMNTSQSKKNSSHFNPNKKINRGDYLTAIGRMILLLGNYSGSILQSISPNYIGITYNGVDKNLLSEVDARGLLLYSPLVKKGRKRTIESKKEISGQEAYKVLEQALIVLGNTTRVSTIIKNSGSLTRAQTAYALGTIISQYDHTALGNHDILLEQLDTRIKSISGSGEQQDFIIELIKKIKKSSSQSLYKAGIDRDILLQDLSSIALGTLLPKKTKQVIDLTTITDFLITKNTNTNTINNSNKTMQRTYSTPQKSYLNFWSDISL